MRKWWLVPVVLAIFTSSFADEAQMKLTMVKMVNQLEAVKPLISQAKAEQSANPRIRIHFDAWLDAQGHKHNGLRQDIEAIQSSLIQAIDQRSTDPRGYQPIKGDFVGQDHV